MSDEGAETLLFLGDSPLGRTDLLAERVSNSNRCAPPLLHRRGLQTRFLGALRRGVVRLDRGLLAALGCSEHASCAAARGCRPLAVLSELLPARQELGAFTFDGSGARFLCANGITDVRLGRREAVRGDLSLTTCALGCREPAVRFLAAALGVSPLREDIALRALGSNELFVQPRGHRRELHSCVALGALPRVDDAGETREHEQPARRDHRAGAKGRRRGERGRIVRRDEHPDTFGEPPAALRRRGICRR